MKKIKNEKYVFNNSAYRRCYFSLLLVFVFENNYVNVRNNFRQLSTLINLMLFHTDIYFS